MMARSLFIIAFLSILHHCTSLSSTQTTHTNTTHTKIQHVTSELAGNRFTLSTSFSDVNQLGTTSTILSPYHELSSPDDISLLKFPSRIDSKHVLTQQGHHFDLENMTRIITDDKEWQQPRDDCSRHYICPYVDFASVVGPNCRKSYYSTHKTCTVPMRLQLGMHVVLNLTLMCNTKIELSRYYSDHTSDHWKMDCYGNSFKTSFKMVPGLALSSPSRDVVEVRVSSDHFKARFNILGHSSFQLHYVAGKVRWKYQPVNVSIPDGCKTMVSFPRAVVTTYIVLTAKPTGGNERNCVGINSSPYIFKFTPRLSVLTDHDIHGLLFSFHNESFVPEQLPSGSWNCSVSHWPDFRDHLMCNLQRECEGDEDETECPYSSEHCGPGYFPAGDSCFLLEVIQKESSTWTDASDRCLLRKNVLASLKTELLYDGVRQVLGKFVPLYESVTLFTGLTVISPILPLWYSTIPQWIDGTMAFGYSGNTNTNLDSNILHCGLLHSIQPCDKKLSHGIALCEKVTTRKPSNNVIVLSQPPPWSSESPYVTCPSKHVTHVFLVCDAQSVCMSQDSENCAALMTPLPPSLPCRNQVERVPYTLVCDHRADCADGSDEDFCVFQQCWEFSCGQRQLCIPLSKRCDHWQDCIHGEDEIKCIRPALNIEQMTPPAVLDIGEEGRLVYRQLANTSVLVSSMGNTSLSSKTSHSVCPRAHFQCPNNGHCLPVFLRCNGVLDCPFHEDEAGCDQYTCPGFYRCRASTVCVNQSDVCDGRPHCPQHDDELLCGFTCPLSCVCHGLAFFCKLIFPAADYPALRYLDAESTNTTLADLHNNRLLIFLNLAHCGLTDVDEGNQFANLLSLDISNNFFTSMSGALLNTFPRLQALSLSGNPLVNTLDRLHEQFPHVHVLDLSRVHMPILDVSGFSIFTNLHILNLSQTGLDTILETGFQSLHKLRVLDLRGCPVTQFPGKMFQTLTYLQTLYAQTYRLCCPTLLPTNFNLRKCLAPSQDVSSCRDLLGSTPYTIYVFAVALAALVGNSASFVYRTVFNKSKTELGFSVFVTHLSVSDFLMGVYLVIIGLADLVYLGKYVWNDVTWRHSSTCSIAGFLSLLSSEVSALIACLITVDRFLVLCLPYSRLHFGVLSARATSAIVWTLCLVLAYVPLLSVTSYWHFYSQTGICIPLPISKSSFPGHVYSFSTVVFVNFSLFVCIGLGQVIIYWRVRANSLSVTNTTRKSKEMNIARRLFSVVVSNFLCWFPIGLLGLLSSTGVQISTEINVVLAVYVLPLNSALNPFLYTVNVIQERQRCTREENIRKVIMVQIGKKV